ncbi:MAG: 6-phosphofructokinase, partial [Planctomycetota bacterium]|nr:6-phosphofructokinase [Planctomycetota bacterium]
MSQPAAGRAVIGQSGGPTCVINESLAGAAAEAATGGVITQFLGARHGVAGIMAGDFVDLGAVSKDRWEQIAQTPCAALGSVRLKPSEEQCARIFEVFR